MMEHTATPWRMHGEADPDIYGRDGEYVVNQVCSGAMGNDDDGTANAHFIVTACNNFEEMYEALKDVQKYLSTIFPSQARVDEINALRARIEGEK